MVIVLRRECKVRLVQSIQDYINENIGRDDFSADDVRIEFSYSVRHLNRLFCAFFGKTIFEYIRALKLTKSTEDITEDKTILNVALDFGYQSQAGYDKAFYKLFGKTPNDYKRNGVMIPLYIPYPVSHYFNHYYGKGEKRLSNENIVCTAYAVKRPKRKMIVLYAEQATDYFSFCEEKHCDWEGYLNSNANKLDTAAILNLPSAFVKPGYSNIAAGIEIPFDCEIRGLLDEYEVVELEPCELMYFKSQSFENEDDYCKYIDAVHKAFTEFDFKSIGYEVDLKSAPSMNFGAQKESGAKIAIPIKQIKK